MGIRLSCTVEPSFGDRLSKAFKTLRCNLPNGFLISQILSRQTCRCVCACFAVGPSTNGTIVTAQINSAPCVNSISSVNSRCIKIHTIPKFGVIRICVSRVSVADLVIITQFSPRSCLRRNMEMQWPANRINRLSN